MIRMMTVGSGPELLGIALLMAVGKYLQQLWVA